MSEESRPGRGLQAGVRVFFYLEDRERTLNSPTDKITLALTAFADELERERRASGPMAPWRGRRDRGM